MDTATQANQLFGYDVTDAQGTKVGCVDGVWLDAASNRPKFITVKTGRLLGTGHIVPMTGAQIDEQRRTIQVPYGEEQIKQAPEFRFAADLNPHDEEEIYRSYGVQPPPQPASADVTGGGGGTAERSSS